MLLKLTVSDNDYQDFMTKFCRSILNCQPTMKPEPQDRDARFEFLSNWSRDSAILRDGLRKPSAEATEEEIQKTIGVIKQAFNDYADMYAGTSASYLKKKFQCEAVGQITDEWCNGEAFYIIPTSYVGNILCF